MIRRFFLAILLAFLQEKCKKSEKNGLYSNFGVVPCETGFFVPTNGKPLDITRFQRRRSIPAENGINPTETDSFKRSSKSVCGKPHEGYDISTAKKPTMKIVDVFHGKTGGGYLTQFYPPTGPITYLAITQDMNGNFKFVAAEGVNEEGKTLSNGDTNMRTRFTCGAREFVNRWSECGPTHHFAAAIGRHVDVIKKVAKIMNVPLETVTE